MKRFKYLAIASILILAVIAVTVIPSLERATAKSGENLFYEVKASNARLNRRVLGPVVNEVSGVPAEPVHAFVWDGNGSDPIKQATAQLRVDPVGNAGVIKAEWTDRNGHWKFRQEAFFAPDHANGLRVSPASDITELEFGDGVPVNVYLHGDSTAGGAVLPTVFNLIATWGPAEVSLNGEPFENPFDGPAPLWVAHTMTTVGVRNDDGTVRTVDGDIFDPTVNPANGAVDDDDMEFHIVFHDAPGPEMTNNFPPPFSFFYHLTFEDVQVQIKHGE